VANLVLNAGGFFNGKEGVVSRFWGFLGAKVYCRRAKSGEFG